jgi:mRNA interferase HigB
MRVISLKRLRDFWEQHRDAEKPLQTWSKIARRACWNNLQDVRRTYPNADGIATAGGETITVFNIGGNKYRLMVRIRFDYQLINVRVVLTHEEYDRGRWKD